jgi:uncharacterized oxidoreductase
MITIQHDALREYVFKIFTATGIPEEDAAIVSDHLVTSHLLGHDSHGVWFAPGYVRGMKANYRRWDDHVVDKDGPAFAVIDGKGANGIVAVNKAVELAVEKARQSTFGFVGLRNVSHIGRLGDYPPRIAKQGMIGTVWLNGGGLFMAPFGSADRRLRPEPTAYAVPRKNGPPFMLDITMSVVAGGKIEQKIVRDEPIPEGWLIDQNGDYVTDHKAYRNEEETAVPPLGGLQFGHKGAGLAMMVEMIVGPLTGAGCTKGDAGGGGGIMVLAIDIQQFTDLDTYTSEVEGLADWIHSARPLPGVDRVLMPGEIEEEIRLKRQRDGIEIPEKTWEALGEAATELGVPAPQL